MHTNFKHALSFCLKGLSSLAVLALLLTPAQSKADTVYTTLGSFNAATTGTTTVTFNGIASPGGFVNETSPLALGGLTFTTGSTLFVIDPGFYASSYAGGGFLNADFSTPDILTVTLPSVTAIGFNFGGLFSATGSFPVTLSDGFSTSISSLNSISSGSLDFVGFTSSTPLTSITLTLPDAPSYSALDNFVYGSAVTSGAVPEPATFGLMLTGLLGTAAAVRRRMQS